jgi:hypothetical protein
MGFDQRPASYDSWIVSLLSAQVDIVFRLLTLDWSSLGSLGVVAIKRALDVNFRALIPPDNAVEPLSRQDWIEYVMIPEVGRMIIQQDMFGSSPYDKRGEGDPADDEFKRREEARAVLKESREYGRLRFHPDSDFDTSDADWKKDSKDVAESLFPRVEVDLTEGK